MIQLQDIKPEPIFDGHKNISSDIWATTLTFEKGKNYLVTAPSGKGKSTLLHLIYGIRKDYTGSIQIDGATTNSLIPDAWSELRQSKLSIVFQDLRLFPNLTALENIQLKNELSDHKTNDWIQTTAKEMGVDHLLDKKCATLSYGQRQRIAIIRSLCQPFDFLLLDEPFSHLDDVNIEIASSIVQKELETQNAALIMVSLGEKFNFEYDFELLL